MINVAHMDLIQKLRPWFTNGTFKLRADGKIDFDRGPHHDSPWIFHKRAYGRKCYIWQTIHFACLGLLPSPCMECWKVVVRPRSLQELFQFLGLMHSDLLDRPSKCGIERRDSVPALYGAYFYTDSIEEGRDCYMQVRKVVDEHLSPDVKVLLKRACTEFEHKFGDSSKWSVTQEQLDTEKVLSDILVWEDMEAPMAEWVEKSIMRRWVEWAFAHGDETYKLYTGGKPLYPEYTTYHDGVEEIKI